MFKIIMKRLAFVALLLLVGAVGVASARYVWRPAHIPPRLTLPAAYEKAVKELGSLTNRFHCLSASARAVQFSLDGEWQFQFFSTNKDFRLVIVPFQGKVIVLQEYPEA